MISALQCQTWFQAITVCAAHLLHYTVTASVGMTPSLYMHQQLL